MADPAATAPQTTALLAPQDWPTALVEAFDHGETPHEASERLGIPMRHVYRLAGRSDVRKAMDRARRIRKAALQARVVQLGDVAMDVLETVMQDPMADPAVRVQAAEKVGLWALGRPHAGPAEAALQGRPQALVQVNVGATQDESPEPGSFRERLVHVLDEGKEGVKDAG